MFDHLRHLQSAVSYHKRTLFNPWRLASLASAWWRNEVAFIQRSDRLSNILGVDPKYLDELFEEAAVVMSYCSTRLQQHSSVLPGLLNPNYGPVLYSCVRVLQPEIIVETGVGSGVSSTFYLSAMEQNDKGVLYSIDLPLPNTSLLPETKQTGWLVPDELSTRWELVLGDSKTELPNILSTLGQIDCFYHDSDHSYEHMMWEFSTIFPYIRNGGSILSDDITNNTAWREFTSEHSGSSTEINRTGVFIKD